MSSNPTELTVQTLTDLAAFFGVSRDTIRKDWRSQGVVPQTGPFNLSQIVQAKLNRLARNEATGRTGAARENYDQLAVEKLQQEVAKLKEDVRSKQRENEAGEGTLVRLQEVELAWVNWAMTVRSHLSNLPTTCSNLAPAEKKAFMKDLVAGAVYGVLERAEKSNLWGESLEDLIIQLAEEIKQRRDKPPEKKRAVKKKATKRKRATKKKAT